MGRGDLAYDAVLVAHVLGAIVGFGTVFLNGAYGAHAKARQGPEGVAIGEANLAVSRIAEWFIYSVAVSGVALVLLYDVWGFDQLWVWLSMLLYAGAVAYAALVQNPTARRVVELSAQLTALSASVPVGVGVGVGAAGPPPDAGQPPRQGPPPQVRELQTLGRRLAVGGAALNLALVVVLVLMLRKPGL